MHSCVAGNRTCLPVRCATSSCVDLWGIGQTGKPWLRWLQDQNITVRHGYDINERKVHEKNPRRTNLASHINAIRRWHNVDHRRWSRTRPQVDPATDLVARICFRQRCVVRRLNEYNSVVTFLRMNKATEPGALGDMCAQKDPCLKAAKPQR